MHFYLLILFKLFFVPASGDVPANIYDFKISALKGGTIDLAKYKGKKILIVNTPIDADNAYQYADLESTYQQYKDKLVIIGCMAPDFAIEPGSRKDNLVHRERNYNVSFPLTDKVLVRGDDMSPLFKWLTEQKYNHLKDNEVKWDFQKYLINERGELVAIFDPKVKANSPEVIAAITK
jgi:glutathione peroxidase